jgi:hypothetical protein
VSVWGVANEGGRKRTDPRRVYGSWCRVIGTVWRRMDKQHRVHGSWLWGEESTTSKGHHVILFPSNGLFMSPCVMYQVNQFRHSQRVLALVLSESSGCPMGTPKCTACAKEGLGFRVWSAESSWCPIAAPKCLACTVWNSVFSVQGLGRLILPLQPRATAAPSLSASPRSTQASTIYG